METAIQSVKTKWGIDNAHSEIAFKVKHLMICSIKGVFRKFEGSFYTTGNDFMTSEIGFFLHPASVDTGNEQRDNHLKSDDFFDVENHPQISFTGETYEKVNDDGGYRVYGNLTIKGITNQIELDVEFGGVTKDLWGNERAGFAIRGNINRKDWGLTYNAILETGGVMISDDVCISCEVELVKQV